VSARSLVSSISLRIRELRRRALLRALHMAFDARVHRDVFDLPLDAMTPASFKKTIA